MVMFEQDPDVVRWGLHQLLDVCSISNGGSPCTLTKYEELSNNVNYVEEGYSETNHAYVENDAIIAHALQEELSRLRTREEHLQAAILSQDWRGDSMRDSTCGHENSHEEADEMGIFSSCSSRREDQLCSPEIADESSLDGEVGKRFTQMVPVPHIPKINGQIPSADEVISDHQRLLDRLQLYDLVQLKVEGDGNCQFRALSDQIYRSTEYHAFVREAVVNQLKSQPESYEGYVPMAYDDYLKKMSKSGEWGDHVSLQAAADEFGLKIFVMTSFKDTCYIEILPHIQKSNRTIFLSFWAEVHYNSIYPAGDLPVYENKKKKSWWKKLGNC